jgi:hypothetical protein
MKIGSAARRLERKAGKTGTTGSCPVFNNAPMMAAYCDAVSAAFNLHPTLTGNAELAGIAATYCSSLTSRLPPHEMSVVNSEGRKGAGGARLWGRRLRIVDRNSEH